MGQSTLIGLFFLCFYYRFLKVHHYLCLIFHVHVDKLEKGRLLNYFNLNNMDMKMHMLICVFIYS
jgi:hypothetical protein